MNRTSLLSILVIAVAIDASQPSLTAAQLPAEGLVAAWAFDETGGDQVKDSSGHNHHGVLRGATRAAGKSGGAIECRKDALVEVPHAAGLDDFKDGITVSAWVNRAADTTWNTVASREIKGGISEYFGLAVVKNKALFSVDGDGAHYQNIKSEEDVPVGEWVHLAGTYDNREFKLFVNGRLVKSAPYTVPLQFADTNPLLIGGNSNSQGKSWVDCFYGRIDEVRLYGRALASSEVAVLASVEAHPTAPKSAGKTEDKAEARDVFPVFTERSFANVWKPATGFNPFFKDANRTRPFAELTASFHIFGGAENMGENERGRIDPKFSGSPEVLVPEGKVCLRFSALTKGAMAGMTLKDLKLPNQDPTGEKRGWRGSTPFEEYIADFSTYKDVGKFHFRYWARKGEKFKVQAKVQDIDVVGTGQWKTVIIEPLHKELHTHHILIMFQNLNDGPAELYLDDVFYYKGDLPAANAPQEKAAANMPNPTWPFIRPEAQKVCDYLQNLTAVSKEELARDIAVLAPGGLLKAEDQDLVTFVGDLVQSLSGRKVSADHAAVLAGDLEQTLDPGRGSRRLFSTGLSGKHI